VRTEQIGELAVLRFESFDQFDGLSSFVSTRVGGVSTGPYDSLNLGLHVGDEPSSVIENRRRVLRSTGSSLEQSVWCQQIHRPNIALVDDQFAGRGSLTVGDALQETDALITQTRELTLCVMLADCVPVVLYDSVTRSVGVIHAGWGGTVREIVVATVAAMVDAFGTEPVNLTAGIGPSIGPSTYEVGKEVIELALKRSWGEECLLPHQADGKAMFDLWTANRRQLEAAGVPPSQIEVAMISTDANQGTLFSDRSVRPTGRFICAATLLP
jgi:polyphenol oxidase